MSDETVHINISIQIDTEGVYDTGITVDAWNSMTDAERAKVTTDLWLDEAGSHDNGGMRVVTADAEDI